MLGWTAIWSSMYGDVKEAIPPDAPTGCRKEVDICLFVGSNHAGDKFICHSCTGKFLHLSQQCIDNM